MCSSTPSLRLYVPANANRQLPPSRVRRAKGLWHRMTAAERRAFLVWALTGPEAVVAQPPRARTA